jgi:peptidyl-prolyl cis-trans isomerase B (cyclophilin B)
MKNPIVTLEINDYNAIKIELYPNKAKNTVNNFIELVSKGFYDGLIFHRIIAGFMIQGGDPQGSGMGGPGYHIPGEFKSNGYDNDLSHERGVISMARAQNPDSAGSQFFIMHKDAPHLNGLYAAFGRVIEGMDTVDLIASVKTNRQDRPLDEQKIKKASVELYDYKIEEVVKSK